MNRGIVIVDESNSTYSTQRAAELLERLQQASERLNNPPLGLSWDATICSAKEIKKRISEFWLAWVHNGGTSSEFKAVTEAAISQEKKANGLSTIIVFYGGSWGSKFPTHEKPNKHELKVASRILWTRKYEQVVEHFAHGQASRWKFEGFLLSVSQSYPEVSDDQLRLLCGIGDDSPRPVTVSSIVHSTENVIRILECEMIDSLNGCESAKKRFLGKAPTVLRAISDLQDSTRSLTKDVTGSHDLQALVKGLNDLSTLISKLSGIGEWEITTADQGEQVLKTLNEACRNLRSTSSSSK